jgi:hypothetical protein
MPSSCPRIHNLEQLRQYVYHALCLQNDFEPGAFELTERYLIRDGIPCGIYFCLHGPRSVKLTAIWETDRNTVLFYNSTGERTSRTHLQDSLTLAAKAA